MTDLEKLVSQHKKFVKFVNESLVALEARVEKLEKETFGEPVRLADESDLELPQDDPLRKAN